MPAAPPPVFPDVVEEHFDELDFLWEHRESNVFTPDWTPVDLAEHEERAEANRDALRIAGVLGIEQAFAGLDREETFAATAATLVLLDDGRVEHLDRVLFSLQSGNEAVVDGTRVALRHAPVESTLSALPGLLSSDDPFRAVAAWDVLAFHRLPAPGAEALLEGQEPGLRAVALGAAGRMGTLSGTQASAAMASEDAGVRRAALEAAARMGMPNLLSFCRAAATRDIDPDPAAVAFLGVLGDVGEVDVLYDLLARRELAVHVLSALGALGRVEAVPILLELTADEVLGEAATRAYRRITGATDIEGEKPIRSVEEEDDEEGETLPPSPEKARADWEARERGMTPDVRWQSGFPIPAEGFPATFQALPLDARWDLYLHLRARYGAGIADVELEALVHRQVAR